MTNQFITALILGFIGGVIPGPVLTATFTEILQSGILKSLRIIFWAMFTETVVALISLIIFSVIKFPDYFFQGLSIVGAGILILMSISILKVKSIDSGQKINFSLGKISAMILANGTLWMYWITVCVPKAILSGEKMIFGAYLFLIFVEIGWLISTFSVAVIFSSFRKILSHPKIVPAIFKIFSLTFFYFAINMIYSSINFFYHKLNNF
ncbi:MAG: hypothetical protein PHT51_05010 [Patescibacteria group bacterium]|nr:hypothetical protein [Patescibacteria group bacterium]MDD4610712.1 hypothetical protein [Patescibacteria group bacterium]